MMHSSSMEGRQCIKAHFPGQQLRYQGKEEIPHTKRQVLFLAAHEVPKHLPQTPRGIQHNVMDLKISATGLQETDKGGRVACLTEEVGIKDPFVPSAERPHSYPSTVITFQAL